MDQIISHLVGLSDKLDKSGNIKCANNIDSLIKSQSLTKVAQYVGAIGYVLKQNRAMGNCVRKKRVASNDSMQEIVLGCLKEYQDGQEYGTNDWTSKYAQVIEQVPENFNSTHINFLQAIADENDMQSHINNVKVAYNLLKECGEKSKVFESIIEAVTHMDNFLKEGDADHRPFKVAAPSSQRGFWSRLFSPSWSKGGQDKDALLEMDNVLEALMNVSNASQQLRTNISRLRHSARSIQDENIRNNINLLSDDDWEKTVGYSQNLFEQLGNNSNTFEAQEILHNMSSNLNQIYEYITQIQRNMQNLRQRNAIKGMGTASSAAEYGDLDRALSKLYSNPLDPKAMFYSQKLHGRLMDALNNRVTSMDPNFEQWSQELSSKEDVPTNPTESITSITEDPQVESIENSVNGINDPEGLSVFIKALDEMLVSQKLKPETNEAFRALREQAQEKRRILLQNSISQEPGTMFASNAHILVKMADLFNDLDPEINGLLKEYIEKHSKEEDILPDFPENASILKEHQSSIMKIKWEKKGKVTLNTELPS